MGISTYMVATHMQRVLGSTTFGASARLARRPGCPSRRSAAVRREFANAIFELLKDIDNLARKRSTRNSPVCAGPLAHAILVPMGDRLILLGGRYPNGTQNTELLWMDPNASPLSWNTASEVRPGRAAVKCVYEA